MEKMFFRAWIIALLWCGLSTAEHSQGYKDDGVVTTKNGIVQGTVLGNARQFLSVPYAKPPIENLRWTDPQKHAAWPDTYDATYCRPKCIQSEGDIINSTSTSDDCLYNTIYTPLLSSTPDGDNNGWPVMIWIHGGSFISGDSCGVDGSVLAHRTNIVVVSIAYRLGTLGFLWDDEIGLNGNYGLKDQLLAIEWVYDNIAAFGGDPNRIFIAGQSAGATSVAVHLMNSEDSIVKGAIMESNPAGVPLRDPKTWGIMAASFKDALGCSSAKYPQPSDQLSCMRSHKKQAIIVAQDAAIGANTVRHPSIFFDNFMPFSPTVGSDIQWLNTQPIFAFQSGNIKDIPILGGTNRNESGCFDSPIKIFNDECLVEFDDLFGIRNAKTIEQTYDCPNDVTNDCRNCSKPIQTDSIFACPFRNMTMSAAKHNKKMNYWYHFNHVSSLEHNCPGGNPCHSTELPYIWNSPSENWGAGEEQLSDIIQLYWGSFVRSGGDPNMYASVGQNALFIPWMPYNGSTQATMMFDVGQLEVALLYEYDTYYCGVWDTLNYTWYK